MKKFFIDEDVLNNPKIGRLDGDTVKFWLFLLALANGSDVRGTLPYSEDDIDYRTRVLDLEKTRAMLKTLLERGLLERDPDGVLRLHDWDDYQVQEQHRPSAGAARTARYRERLKQKRLSFDAPAPAPAPEPAPTLIPSPPPPIVDASPAVAPVAADDEPFNPPALETLPLAEPIGANTAKQVMTARHVAMDLYGGTAVPTLVDGWLAAHSSDRVIHALYAARHKHSPAAYIQTVLDSPAPAAAAASSPRAAPTLGASAGSNDDWKTAMRERARRAEEELEQKEARRGVAAVV